MIDLDRLEKLANLRDRGALTDEEFNQLKNDLINNKSLNNTSSKKILNCFTQSFTRDYTKFSEKLEKFFKSMWLCFMQAITKDYANFSGKSTRREYWSFFPFGFLISLIPYINIVWTFFGFIPTLAITIRRAHDVGLTGWQYFKNYCILSLIFGLLLFAFMNGGNMDIFFIFAIPIAILNFIVMIKMLIILLKPSKIENDEVDNQQ